MDPFAGLNLADPRLPPWLRMLLERPSWSAPARESWAGDYAGRHGGKNPGLQDAFDREWSLRNRGSGPNGTWTDADWRRTYGERQDAWRAAGGRDGGPTGSTGPPGFDPMAAIVGMAARENRGMDDLPTSQSPFGRVTQGLAEIGGYNADQFGANDFVAALAEAYADEDDE